MNKTYKKFHSKKLLFRILRYVLLFSILGFVSITSASCEYVKRFYLVIDEGVTLPCIGVNHFIFTVETLQTGQEEKTENKFTMSSNPTDLFWFKSTGKCQFKEGIPIKKILYGGQRQLRIQGLDSTGKQICSGQSPPFLVEPSGSDVQDEIIMDLRREKTVSTGTIIIQAEQALPPTTAKIQLVLSQFTDPKTKKTYQEEIRTVHVNPNVIQNFIIVSGIPAANGRFCFVQLLDSNDNIISKTPSLSYTIKENNNNNNKKDLLLAGFRISLNPNP